MTYLMATMTLGTLSICMTVIILNIHHRGASQRMPAWLRRAAFVYAARLLCVKTPYAHESDDGRPQQSSSSSAAINVEVSPPPSPIEPIWKRRSDDKPPSPPATKLPDLPRSCVRRGRLELTLLRMFRRSERPPSAVPTCNGCAFVGDSRALTAVPPRRRRSRANGASQSRTGNGRVTVPRDLTAPSTDSTSTRDEVLSPLLKTPRLTIATRRHSAAVRRLELAGHSRSEAAWSTLDSGVVDAGQRRKFDAISRRRRRCRHGRAIRQRMARAGSHPRPTLLLDSARAHDCVRICYTAVSKVHRERIGLGYWRHVIA